MNIQRDMAEVNGTRLYYESVGSGEAVILIHGFSLDRRTWDGSFEMLAEAHHAVRYDVRGFGRSELPGEIAYRDVDDLAALMDWLEIQRATLIGLSMGGGIAVDFALTYPERVRGLVVVDSLVSGFRWSDEGRVLDAAVWAAARDQGIEAGKAAWLKHPLIARGAAHPECGARVRQMVGEYSGWHFVNRSLQSGIEPRAITRLDQISVPTLVVVGELDQPDFRAMAEALSTGIPGAEKAVIKGVGHLANMEGREKFGEVVGEFIRGVEE
jgi:pimeloyl-ACP methyl ester carboxylesterase